MTVVDVPAPLAALGTHDPGADARRRRAAGGARRHAAGRDDRDDRARHAAARARPHGRPAGRHQRRDPAPADAASRSDLLQQFSESLTAGQPARGRGHDREAQAGAGRVIRLGIRVRADDAEIAFARLEPVLAAGAEEVELDELVEFAVYGDDAASDARAARAGRRHALDVTRSAGRTRLGVGLARRTSTPVTVGALHDPPAVARRRPDDLVIEPGPTFGAASHPTTRLCLELLQELEPAARWPTGAAGSGVLAIAAARLGFAPGVRDRARPGRGARRARATPRATASTSTCAVGDVTHARAVGADGRREPHAAAARRALAIDAPAGRADRLRRPRRPACLEPAGAASSASGASSTAGRRSCWSARDPARGARRARARRARAGRADGVRPRRPRGARGGRAIEYVLYGARGRAARRSATCARRPAARSSTSRRASCPTTGARTGAASTSRSTSGPLRVRPPWEPRATARWTS